MICQAILHDSLWKKSMVQCKTGTDKEMDFLPLEFPCIT